jgi:hypothetical protein
LATGNADLPDLFKAYQNALKALEEINTENEHLFTQAAQQVLKAAVRTISATLTKDPSQAYNYYHEWWVLFFYSSTETIFQTFIMPALNQFRIRVIRHLLEQDPLAYDFFSQFYPWLKKAEENTEEQLKDLVKNYPDLIGVREYSPPAHSLVNDLKTLLDGYAIHSLKLKTLKIIETNA